MEQENFITIRNYSDHIVADIAIAALHAEGIETFVLRENRNIIPTDNVEIRVKESHIDRAKAILLAQEGEEV